MRTPQEIPAPGDWNWRRETAMVLVLSLLVFVGYFCRASTLFLGGEEPRRALVAVEMIDSGDWVVPHVQGEPFFSRPPLQNWLIAVCYLVSGERDAFGARLPSLVATWLMVLVIYGYGRTFMTRTGAVAAAAAFATFGEVLQECRTAETEALFTLFVSGPLLVWHWGMTRGWPDVLAWSLVYGLMALGMLAKSLQAPFYFLVSVTVFLVLTQQWRRLFSWAHLAGMAVGVRVLPLYPCMAVLVGFAVQRCGEAPPASALGLAWRRCLLTYAGVMFLVAVTMPTLGFFSANPIIRDRAEPLLAGIAFGAVFLGLAWLTGTMALSTAFPWRTGAAAGALAGFMVVLFTGPVLNTRVRRGNDVAAQIAELKAELPDVQFVSIGPTHAELPFFSRQFVKPLPLSTEGARAVPPGAYFCFSATGPHRLPLPYAWQEVKVIPIDRNRRAEPEDVLVIARRISANAER